MGKPQSDSRKVADAVTRVAVRDTILGRMGNPPPPDPDAPVYRRTFISPAVTRW